MSNVKINSIADVANLKEGEIAEINFTTLAEIQRDLLTLSDQPRTEENDNKFVAGCFSFAKVYGLVYICHFASADEGVRAVFKKPLFAEVVFELVLEEMNKQRDKWGQQNHPSVCPVLTNREGGVTPERLCEEYEIPTEARAKSKTDTAAERKELTWVHIAVEELSEAVCAKGHAERREEVIQLIAVLFNWVGSIERNELKNE